MNIQQKVLPLLTSARRLTAGASPLLVNTLTAANLPQCQITVCESFSVFRRQSSRILSLYNCKNNSKFKKRKLKFGIFYLEQQHI